MLNLIQSMKTLRAVLPTGSTSTSQQRVNFLGLFSRPLNGVFLLSHKAQINQPTPVRQGPQELKILLQKVKN